MIKTIYLLDPYNDIIKVNALSDSVFTLKLNGAISYSNDEILAKVNETTKINMSEDEITRLTRFISAQMSNTIDLRHLDKNRQNMMICVNSYARNICGGISEVAIQMLRPFLGNVCDVIAGGDINGGHQWNAFNEGSYDQINKIPFYKNKYIGASFEDLQSDRYLYTEPLFVVAANHITDINYTSYVTNSIKYSGNLFCSTLGVVNSIIKIPGGSSFVFPVKSSNQPKTEGGVNLEVWANLILTIPIGIIGNIEMPFSLMQITGEGIVNLDGINYTLPTDEAALKIACQTTQYEVENWLNKFLVTENTGGLNAEFLVNQHNLILYHKNILDYEITSGSISFERVKTEIPIPTYPLSVKQKDSAGWTMNFYQFFTKDKSFKHPICGSTWDDKMVYYLPNEYNKYSSPKIHKTITANTITSVIADTATYGKCWSAKLMPRQNTFTGNLELSFAMIDDSNIYYTLDGSTPDSTKTLYTTPFTISATTTVKWINIKTDYENSHVNSRVITKTA